MGKLRDLQKMKSGCKKKTGSQNEDDQGDAPDEIIQLFILTIKLRKSPFDLSYSHHAHQDLVKGVTTEMSGKVLGQVEIMHWCENVLFLAWIALFFVWNSPVCIIAVVVALVLVYFLEIWIDNNFARVKWQLLLKSAWIVTLVFAGINIALLVYL